MNRRPERGLPFPSLLSLLLPCALATGAGCGPHRQAAAEPGPTSPTSASPDAETCAAPRTFVFVRHAEKESQERDSPLSQAGLERAKRLGRMLATAKVTRLVATEARRTQDTLAPLAEQIHLGVEVRPAAESDALARELAASTNGAVVVVAGHSNTIPALVAALGPKGPPPSIGESQFGQVFVVTSPRGRGCGNSALLELSSD